MFIPAIECTSSSDDVSFITLSDASAVQELIEYFDTLSHPWSPDNNEKVVENSVVDNVPVGNRTVEPKSEEQVDNVAETEYPVKSDQTGEPQSITDSQVPTINTTRVESLFKKKKRRLGDLKLSSSNLREYSTNSSPNLPIAHDVYQGPNKLSLSRDDSIIEKIFSTAGHQCSDLEQQKDRDLGESDTTQKHHSTRWWSKSVGKSHRKKSNAAALVTNLGNDKVANFKAANSQSVDTEATLTPKAPNYQPCHGGRQKSNSSNFYASVSEVDHQLGTKGFNSNHMELFLRHQLNDEKVVPLSNAIFNEHQTHDLTIPMTKSCKTPTERSGSTYKQRLTKATIKAMLDRWSWNKKPVSDSAEFENQIFSPGTHRPSTIDVPGIDEVESEEENPDDEHNERRFAERGRSQSTISSLFGSIPESPRSASRYNKYETGMQNAILKDPGDQESDDFNDRFSPFDASLDTVMSPTMVSKQPNEPLKPALKRSRWSKRYHEFKGKSPSLRVRFLSPIHSAWSSST